MSELPANSGVMSGRARAFAIAGVVFLVWLLLFVTDETTFRPLEHFLTYCDNHLRANFRFFRHFGSMYATLLGMALIYALAPRLRRQLLPLLLAVAIAGGGSDLLKNSIARDRPEENDGRSVFSPPFSGFKSKDGESMPSGHSTLAFANAAVFSALLPPAQPVFLVVATLTGLSRVREGDHFISDVYFGAVIGWFLTPFLMIRIRRLFKIPDPSV